MPQKIIADCLLIFVFSLSCSEYISITYEFPQMVYDADGIRPMGKCFVQFNSLSDSEAALNKFGEKMGSRFLYLNNIEHYPQIILQFLFITAIMLNLSVYHNSNPKT